MPPNIRQTSKRELDRAVNNLDMAMHHISAVSETYKEAHPEITERLELIGGVLIEIQDQLNAVNAGI